MFNRFITWLWIIVTSNPIRVSQIGKHLLNVLAAFSIIDWDTQQFATVNILIGLVFDETVKNAVTPNTKVVAFTGKRGADDIVVKGDKVPEGVVITGTSTGATITGGTGDGTVRDSGT